MLRARKAPLVLPIKRHRVDPGTVSSVSRRQLQVCRARRESRLTAPPEQRAAPHRSALQDMSPAGGPFKRDEAGRRHRKSTAKAKSLKGGISSQDHGQLRVSTELVSDRESGKLQEQQTCVTEGILKRPIALELQTGREIDFFFF